MSNNVRTHFCAFTCNFNAQITVNPSNAVNVTMELVNLTAKANLKAKDLENTVEVVENLVKTLSSLDSEEITEASFSYAEPTHCCFLQEQLFLTNLLPLHHQ